MQVAINFCFVLGFLFGGIILWAQHRQLEVLAECIDELEDDLIVIGGRVNEIGTRFGFGVLELREDQEVDRD